MFDTFGFFAQLQLDGCNPLLSVVFFQAPNTRYNLSQSVLLTLYGMTLVKVIAYNNL